jgi:hypothetical protein
MSHQQISLLEQINTRLSCFPATTHIDGPEFPLITKPKNRKSALMNHSHLYQERLCSLKRCCCVCHDAITLLGGPWFLTLPLSSWSWKGCNKAFCRNAKSASFWVSLTQIGVPLAVRVSLDFVLSSQQSHITPSLSFQRVVRRTSPGFKLLFELAGGHRQDWDKARQDLLELFKSGEASPRDIDPDGKTWLDVCCVIPWLYGTC